MKIKATCFIFGCPANRISKSFILLRYGGHGKDNNGVECPVCHQPMRITQTIATPGKRAPVLRIYGQGLVGTRTLRRKETAVRKDALSRKRIR